MTYFHGICHRNCALMNVGAVLEFRKLDFKGIKGQLDLKRTSFRRLIPKIGHYWPILLLEPTYDAFLWDMPLELCPKLSWRVSSARYLIVINFRGH